MKADFDDYKRDVEKNLHIINKLLRTITHDQDTEKINNPELKKTDFRELIAGFNTILDELEILKDKLNEQNKINELRIKIWQIAARKYLSEKSVIQQLLNLVGTFFNVSYASFYRFNDNNNAVCEIQWKNRGNKSTLGLIIPYHIHKHFHQQEYLVFYNGSLPLKIKRDVLQLFKRTGVNSFLAVPYREKGKVSGFFDFSEKNACCKWKPVEIEILKEISKIISIKAAEINAEEALIQITERLDKKVADHTLELQKANENMKKDIKKRRRIEKALRESEELYRTLIFTSPNPVIIIDLDFKIKMINRAVLELCTLHDEGEIIGKNAFNYIAIEDHQNLLDNVEILIKTGSLVITEFCFIKDDGTPYPAELNASVICDSEGDPIAYLCVIRDLTEKKEAEEALEKEKELFEVTLRSISDAVVTISRDKRIVFCNRVAADLISMKHEEITGQDFQTIFRFVDRNNKLYDTMRLLNLFEEGKITAFYPDMRFITPGGKKIPIAGSGAPLRSKNSSLIGVVLVFRDISEQKRLEDELFVARNMESLGVLAGGLAHDFNNILTGIITNISLAHSLLKGSDEVKELIRYAERAALRASRLTNQLLTFSRGGAPVKENSSIKKLITESVNFCLSGANVHCEFFLPDDLWSVEVDRGQVYQVLNNILFNAKESMPNGGKITLTARNIELPSEEEEKEYNTFLKPGKYIIVSIQDEGTGINEENLEKIFDPYFTTKDTGTGLGLTSAYSIIKKHGGYINVNSFPGKGTLFEFYLPATGIVSKVEEIIVQSDFTGCGTILIMDDDEDVRKVLERLLEKTGYKAVSTAEGGQAIKEYKKARKSGNPFDLVIMDLTVRGGMQGMEAVHFILEYDPDARIIVSSGYSNAQIMANYKDYGIKAVIAKPFAMETFLELIKKVCEE
ncbi:MAG: PAS domain S-box protein [Spirochaetales bacterium]|nr:PAS domain S-box protein [Spirochaetales bacterium]